MAAKKSCQEDRERRQPTRRRRPPTTKKTARDDRRRSRRSRSSRRARSTTVTKGDNPAVEIRTRALSNVSFNEKKKIIELGDRTQSREFFNTAMARKFMQTMLVASGCKTLIDEGKTVSIRQMYLHDEAHAQGHRARTRSRTRTRATRSSRTSRSASTRCARSCTSSPTGGASSSASSSSTTRATRSTSRAWAAAAGASRASASPTSLKFVESKAEFILFVEKQAVWHRLNEDRFWEKHNCILMTSEGQAARGARRLLQRMADGAEAARSTSSSITIRGGSTSTRCSSRGASTSPTSRCAWPSRTCASSG